MRKVCSFIFALVAFGISISCLQQLDDPDYVDQTGGVQVAMNIMAASDTVATKSSISPSEDKIANYSVFIYQNGRLARDIYVASRESSTVELHYDQTYNVYVLANTGKLVAPEEESKLKDFTYSVNNLSAISEALPMCQNYGSITVVDGLEFDFVVERLVSKVTFNMNALGVSGLNVKSVQIRQTPLAVRPFAPQGSKATIEEVKDGDYATEADITALNSNGSVVFYMFENMQGTLLSGNTDPWNKVPENIAGSESCTYIETVCEFDQSVSAREGTVTYRMYLGEDNVSNFDVERNKVVSVSLTATEEGLEESSWKIVSDYVQHVTSVTLDKKNLVIPVGESAQLNATVLPEDADNKTVLWESSDPKIASVNDNGKVIPLKVGSCKIIARSDDMRDIYDECSVTVKKANLKSISIDNGNMYLLKADNAQTVDLSVTAEFMDGTSETVVSSAAKYSSNNTDVAVVNADGRVTAKSLGTATITASYTLTNADNTSTTETASVEVYVSALALETTSLTLKAGETKALKAILTNHNGTESSPTLIWSSSKESVATVASGAVTGVSPGTADVTGTYSGQAGSGSVKAIVSVSNNLKSISVTPASVELEKNETQQLSVTGTYDDNSTVTDATAFSWSSSNSSVASVDANGKVTAVGIGTATITASKDGITSNNVAVTVKASVSYSLSVSPTNGSNSIGGTTKVTAIYYTITDGVSDAGTDVTSLATWTSSNTGIATVSAGTVTAVSIGNATITAEYNGYSATFAYSVTNKIKTIVISPLGGTYKVGETVQMNVTATYENGDITKDASLFTWSSTDNSVATVSATGLVTMKGVGLAKIKASKDGVVSNVSNFEPYIETTSQLLSVYYGITEIPVGETTTHGGVWLYTYTYRNGSFYKTERVDVASTDCSWTSSDSNIATVSSTGTVTGVKAGSVEITTTYNGKSITNTIIVGDVTTYKDRIVLSYNASSINVGSTTSPTIKLYTDTYTNGTLTTTDTTPTTVSASSCTWSSGTTSVATVSSAGVVTGVASGSSKITCTYSGSNNSCSSSVTISVTNNVTYKDRITLSYNATSIKVGGTATPTVQLYTDTYTNGTLTATDTTPTTVSASSCSWTSATTSSVTVSSSGIATGVSSGSSKITCTYVGSHNSCTANVTITVSDSVSYSYSLEITGSTSVKIGSKVTFSVKLTTKTYTNGTLTNTETNTIDNSKCTWSSSSTSIATVTSSGVATGVSNGTVTITAKWNSDTSVTDTLSLTVNSSSTGTDWDDDDGGNVDL